MPMQFNLFSDEPEPLPSIKKRLSQSRPRFIKYCTTKQAAILLDVSLSTLYRSRQSGQSYQKNGCTAKATGPNCWQVIL